MTASAAESLADQLPSSWRELLAEELATETFANLAEFLAAERRTADVYPPANDLFAAFRWTSPEAVRVLLLGQDPYHGAGQAHGLAFSVPVGVPLPPSLRNMFRELASDLNCPPPKQGDLTGWAEQGVLLLNTVLTVRAGAANSHKNRGWELFTDAVIRHISDTREHVVFILWGAAARKKQLLVDSRHTILASAHPSPLSAHNGFFGSRPFSQTNTALTAHGQSPIDWQQITSDVQH